MFSKNNKFIFILSFLILIHFNNSIIVAQKNISKQNEPIKEVHPDHSIRLYPFGFNPDKIDSLSANIETLGTFSGGDFAPFWLTNNKFGLSSAKNNSEYIRANLFNKYNFSPNNTYKQSTLSLGVDMIASHNMESDFYFHQLYADYQYWNLHLSIGKKERYSLFKNKDLSSGGMTLSTNSRPVPQVELSMPNFVTLPYSKGYLQVMGGVSYGWFDDDKFKKNNSADGNYADKVLYHRKYGFIKYEKNPTWNFIFGAEMDTQWGGHFYHAGEYWDKGTAKLSDFLKVLIPMQGGEDSNLTDRQNIIGNVYGSWHFIGNYMKEDYSLKLYYEHFFEDHSGVFFKNMPDGLYGIELNLNKKGWLTDALFEFLYSKDQSGPFLWDKNDKIPVQISGGDNYYNHVDYVSLSYHGFTTGNPLFTSPIYNKGESLTIFNSRLSAFHGGVSGYITPELKYRALMTYSRSWGTDRIPSKSIRNQFSSMLEAIYKNDKNNLRGWAFTAALGYDRSRMIGDNIGGQIKISKLFEIR